MVYLVRVDREGGTRHNERRLLRFGFDDLKLRNFQNCLSKTKQRECPEGVLFTCLCCCIAIGASCCVVANGGMVRSCVYISGVGFCVARLRLARHFLQPLTVKRATVQGFTLFLCLV